VTSGGNNFNDFPDNQLTKFRVFIGLYRIFLTPPALIISMKHRASSNRRMDAPDRHNGHKRTCLFVRLCLRWSLAHSLSMIIMLFTEHWKCG